MSNNKSRHLLRKSGTHTVFERPSEILDVDRMAQLSNIIVAITGKLDTVYLVSDKFLSYVSLYKTDLNIANIVAKNSNLDVAVVSAIFQYFGAMSNRKSAEYLIVKMFEARRW